MHHQLEGTKSQWTVFQWVTLQLHFPGWSNLLEYSSPLIFLSIITSVVRACFCHEKALSQVCPYGYSTSKTADAVAVALIWSKLNYCNSLFSGLPSTQIVNLQAVQNATARIVSKSKKRDLVWTTLAISRQSHSAQGALYSVPLTAGIRSPSFVRTHSYIYADS